MDKKFTPISEIKEKLDEKNKPLKKEGFGINNLLSKVCEYLMKIIIPIIAFIIVVNPLTFKKISGIDEVEMTVNGTLKTTSVFTGLLVLGNLLNYFGII